jgi:UTP--glucose-1-phosphate uridylyltransferase
VAITDAVVPVGGLGTRLLPATRSQPKEMLPVVDTPVVQYVVEELVRAGIARVLFVTGRRKRAIEDHFDADPELDLEPLIDPRTGLQVFYTRQARPAGLGDAIRYAHGFGRQAGIVVALGDAIIETPASATPGIVPRLIDAYERHDAAAACAVQEVPDEAVSRYGIAIGSRGAGNEPFELDAVIEKPDPSAVPSRTAIMGRYVLGPSVFAALRETAPDESGEVQLTAALQSVLESGQRLIAVPLGEGERRHDVGSVESYCATFLEHALVHPRLGPSLRARAAALLDDDLSVPDAGRHPHAWR